MRQHLQQVVVIVKLVLPVGTATDFELQVPDETGRVLLLHGQFVDEVDIGKP